MFTANHSNNKMYTCIYCREQKGEEFFNSEHVLPQSFGLYGSETMTLINKVCAACNKLFGETIDKFLARETREGIGRFSFGLMDNKKIKSKKPQHPQYGKNQIRIITEGDLKGLECKLEYISEQNRPTLIPIKDDIGFRSSNGLYDFYSKEDIPTKAEFENKYPLHESRILILNPQEEDLIREFLIKKLGDGIQYKVYTDNSERNCSVVYTYNIYHFRALSKIAFNYFAYFNTSETLLQNWFDSIRKFIRYGSGDPEYKPWKKCNNTILPEKNNLALAGHVIHIEYDRYSSQGIWVSVALNNCIPYLKIRLTSLGYTGIIQPSYGHIFDPFSKKIYEIKKSSIVIPESIIKFMIDSNT